MKYPESWHDSQLSAYFIRKVISDLGIYQICLDQGFSIQGEFCEKLGRNLAVMPAPRIVDSSVKELPIWTESKHVIAHSIFCGPVVRL